MAEQVPRESGWRSAAVNWLSMTGTFMLGLGTGNGQTWPFVVAIVAFLAVAVLHLSEWRR